MTELVITDKHQLILDAAQKRFAHYGLTKVTMDEIAQDIGMGKASLYYYFPTKESLFKAVLAREQDKFLNLMQALLTQELTATQKLQQYLENRAIYLRELLNLNTINLNYFHQMKPIFGDLYQNFAQKELAIMGQILESGQRSTEFLITDPHKIANIILHMLRGLQFFYMKTCDDLESKDYFILTQEINSLVEIILNGIKNPAI